MPEIRHLLMCLGSALALCGCERAKDRPKPRPREEVRVDEPEAAPTKLASASVELRLPKVPRDLSFLAFGGGSDPLSNQISLAQDLELATSVLAGRGFTLFASGPGALLAVERGEPAADEAESSEVEPLLARLFGPPHAERVRYEPATLPIDAPATRDHVAEALENAIEGGEQPLVIYAASHGERGETARENGLSLWGGWSFTVEDAAELLDRAEQPRPTRWVITACYGGGFAELAFNAARPQRGVRSADHCGLFAAPWDDESSGCDPNPDRQKQDAYGMHFLQALRGQGRDGEDRLADIDLDRDARVGLLEAHTWARIHSRSFDIPTTTSERYLREFVRAYEAVRGGSPEGVPEELAVVRALSRELELDDERAARAQLAELDRILADARAELDEAQRASDDGYYALRIALLERWPLLEHAWEPRTRALIAREGARIKQMLVDSELARGYAVAERELEEALAQHDAVRVSRARTLRLVRAHETLRLASVLKRRGGPRYEHYRALRECERFVPEVRAPLRRAEQRRLPRMSPAVEAEAHAK